MAFDPFGTTELVNLDDPRLDINAMDAEAYVKTYDPALIKDKDASKPAIRYLFKPIDFNFFNKHMADHPSSQLVDLAIRAGIVAVRLPDGSTKTPTTKQSDFAQPLATYEWFATLGKLAGYTGLTRVASGVITITKLPEDARPTSPSSPG